MVDVVKSDCDCDFDDDAREESKSGDVKGKSLGGQSLSSSSEAVLKPAE